MLDESTPRTQEKTVDAFQDSKVSLLHSPEAECDDAARRKARVEKALNAGWRVIRGGRSLNGRPPMDRRPRSSTKQAERLQRLRERYQQGTLEYDADAVARRLLMRLLGASE